MEIKKMDLNVIFDVMVIHDKEIAMHAATEIINEFLDSKTPDEIKSRHVEIIKECLGKEGV